MNVPRFENLEDVQQYLDHLEVPTWTVQKMTPLLNSWVDYGAPFGGAELWTSSDGQVELHGLIKLGIGNVVLYTLPPNARPAAYLGFGCLTNTGPILVEVHTNGDIYIPPGGGNTYLTLSGIRFHTG